MRAITLLAISLVYTVTVHAQSDLYTIDVPLIENSTSGQLEAKVQALEWILMRLTGQVDLQDNPTFKSFFNNLTKYTDTVAVRTDDIRNTQILSLGFNKNYLLQDLQTINSHVWLGKRPTLVAWIVLAHDNQMRILENQASDYEDILLAASRQRAIQLTLPLLDLQDLAVVQADTLLQLNKDALLDVSSRYNVDGVIQASISQYKDSTWHLSGRLILGEKFTVLRVQAADYEDLVNQFINKVMVVLFNTFSSNTPTTETNDSFLGNASAQSVILNVSGINALADYAAVNKALKELGVIDAMQLIGVQEDRLYIKIDYTENARVLKSNLALVKSLRPTSATQSTVNDTLFVKQFSQNSTFNSLVGDTQAIITPTIHLNNLWYYTWQPD